MPSPPCTFAFILQLCGVNCLYVMTVNTQVLNALLARIRDECDSLLERTMAAQSGLQGFDFLGNSVLAAVDQQLADCLPGEIKCAPSDFRYAAQQSVEFALLAPCQWTSSAPSKISCTCHHTSCPHIQVLRCLCAKSNAETSEAERLCAVSRAPVSKAEIHKYACCWQVHTRPGCQPPSWPTTALPCNSWIS